MSRSDTAAEGGEELCASSAPQAVGAAAIGKVQTVMGLVTITRANVIVDQPAVGDFVYKGDLIETGVGGLIAIAFVDGTEFHLRDDARLVLDEFNYGADKSSQSALLRVVRGMFGVVSGKLATSGRLIIDTPAAQIRGVAPGAGFFGILTFTVFSFGLIRELQAASSDVSFIDDVPVDYKFFKHGVYELVTKGDHPEVIVVDDPTKTIILRARGAGSYSVQEVTNTPQQMAQLQQAYQSAQEIYLRGQQDPLIQQMEHRADANPQSTGSSGSSQFLIDQFYSLASTITTSAPGAGGPGSTGGPGGTAPPSGVPDSLPQTPTATWLGGSGNWSNPLGWSDSWAPASWQNIVINGVGSFVIIDSGTADTGPTSTAATNVTIGAGATLDIISGGSLTVSGTLTDSGLVEVNSGGKLDIKGSVTGTGTFTIDSATLEFGGSVAAGTVVVFAGTTGTLQLDQSLNFAGIVSNFQVGDVIDLTDLAYRSGETWTWRQGSGSGTLTINDNGTTEILTLTGTYSQSDFSLVPDSNSKPGTEVLLTIDDIWIGPAGGDWSTSSNWSLGVPGPGSIAVIRAGATPSIIGSEVVTVDDVIVLNSGDIEVGLASAGILILDNGTTVTGGNLTIGSLGEVEVTAIGAGAALYGVSVSNGNLILIDNAATLTLDGGTQINGSGTGTLTVESTGELEITGTGATLDDVIVTDSNASDGIDVASGAILTLDGGTQINGSGTGALTVESGGQLQITTATGATLDGVIVDDDATGTGSSAGIYVASGILTLDGGTQIQGGPVAARGTLTIASAGELKITGAGATLDGVDVSDLNTGGANAGIDLASILTLNDSTSISGGTLTVESTGELEITAGAGADGATAGGATLDGVIVTDSNASDGIDVASGAILTLDGGTTISGGTMSIAGTLEIDSGNNEISNVIVTDIGTTSQPSQLIVSGGVLTLEGDSFSGGVIEITVDSGAELVLDNTHIKDAILDTQPGSTLIIPANSSIEAINSTLSGNNVVESGASLTLIDETVTGTIDDLGTLIIGTGTTIFDGVSVDDDNTTFSPPGIDVLSGATLTLENNAQIYGGGSGTLTIESGGQLSITTAGGATLDGVVVTDNANPDGTTPAIDVAANAVLTLNDGTVVSGGTLTVESAGELVITAGSGGGSEGVPDDTSDPAGLVENPGSGATLNGVIVTNTGTLEVAGTLTLSDDLVTNTGGIITVANDGTLDLTGGDTIQSGTLVNSGTLDTSGADTLSGETITNSNLLEVLGGTLTLTNDTIGNSGGQITVDGGATASGTTITSGTVTNDGTLDLTGGDTIQSGTLVNSGTLDTSGADTLSGETITNSNLLEVLGGTLTLTNDTIGNSGGQITVDGGATASGTTITSGTVANDGTLDLTGGDTIQSGTLVNSGTLDTSGADTLSGETITNSNLLEVLGGTLTLTNDTIGNSGGQITVDGGATASGTTITSGTVTNDGTLDLTGGDTIQSGTLVNSGTLDTSGADTLSGETITNSNLLEVLGGTLTLTNDTIGNSGGQITVDGGATASGTTITSGTVANDGTLDLTGGDTIQSGTLVNSGTLDTSGADTLSGETITNSNLLEVLGGTLTLTNDTIGNSGGQITVDGGATASGTTITSGTVANDGTLDLTGGDTIQSGTLVNSGTLDTSGADTLSGETITNSNLLEVLGGTLTLTNDTIGNSGGQITVDGGATASGTTITSGTVTNDGTLDLTGGDTIQSGTLVNSGTLDTSGADTLSGETITNSNLLEVLGGTLTLTNDTIGNSGGQITVDGGATASGTTITSGTVTNDGTLDLTGGDTIQSGTLVNSGTLDTSGADTLSGETITNSNLLEVLGGTLTLTNDTIGNSGGQITVDGGATASGTTITSGTVTNDGTLDLTGGDTIQSGTLVNSGTLDTSGADTLSGETITNSNLLEVLGGTLTLTNDTIGNSGGQITVDGGATASGTTITSGTVANDGTLDLTGGDTIQSGTLVNSGTLDTSGADTLSGETITNSNLLEVLGGTLTLTNDTIGNSGGQITVDGGATASGTTITSGTVTNDGTLDLTGGDTIQSGTLVNSGTLDTSGADTLSGETITNSNLLEVLGGTLTLTNDTIGNSGGQITVDGGATASGTTITSGTVANDGTLDLTGGDTIQSGTLVNSGTLDTSGADTLSGETITNSNLLEVLGGTLTLTNDTIGNSGGQITVDGGATASGTTITSGTVTNDGTLDLTGGDTIQSGTLVNSGTLDTSGADTLSGETITNSNLLEVLGGTLTLTNDTIGNSGGQITVDGGATASGTTITSGTVTNDGTLDLTGGDTIQSGTLVNSGTLDTSGADTLSGETITNSNLLEVLGGTLTLTNDTIGNSGGQITVDGGATASGTTITSGTVTNDGTLDLTGGDTIQSGTLVNSGTLDTSGADTLSGETITNSNLLEVLGGTLTLTNDTIGNSGGQITVDGGATASGTTITSGTVTNDGTLDLTGGDTIQSGTLVNSGTLDTSGADTLSGETITNSNLLEVLGGTLTLTNDTIGNSGGQITVDGGATASGTTITSGTVTNDGTLDLTGGDTIQSGTLVNSGTLDTSGADTLSGETITNSNLLEVLGGTLTLTNDTIGNSGGQITVDGGATASGTTITSGTVANDGTLDLTGGDTIQSGTLVNSGTLDTSGADTLSGETITNSNLLEVLGGTLTLTNDTIGNSGGQITVDGGATASGTTITSGTVTNDGTLDLTGGDTIQSGTLVNSGTLDTSGADTLSGETITNSNLLEVLGGTLTLTNDTIGNSGGQITVDGGATASGTTITSGTVTNDGTLDLTGGDTIQSGTLVNSGTLDTSGADTLSGETITNSNLLEVLGGTLTLTNDTIGNSGGQITVDGGATASGTTITSGTVTNDGTLDLTGGDTIQSGTLVNSGTLDTSGADTLSGETITNSNLLEVLGGTLTLTNDTIGNSGGQITVDGGATASGTTITSGTVTNDGTLDLTGGDTIQSGTLVNSGTLDTSGADTLSGETITNSNLLEVLGGTLTLTNDTIGNSGGQITVDGGATASGTTITSGTVTNDGTLDLTGGDTIQSGTLVNSGTLDTSGADTLSGETITNSNLLEVLGGTLTLTNDTIGNSGGQITVDGGATASGTTITSGTVTNDGTLDLTGGDTIQSGTLVNSGTLDTSGADTLSGETITNSNLLEVLGGTLTLTNTTITSGTITNNGTLDLIGSDVISSSVNSTGTGIVDITSGGSADFVSTVFNQNIAFAGTAVGTLELDKSQVYTGDTVSGFGVGTVIDLTYLTYSSGETFTWVENAGQAAGTLTIQDGAATESLTLEGNYAQSNFTLTNDGTLFGGTDVVYVTVDEWTNTSGGPWATPSDWSGGTPTSTTTAAIALSGTYTVTISGTTDTANSLTISDAKATLDGSGTLSVGTIDNNGTIDASVAGSKLYITGDITGSGTLEISNNAILELGGTATNIVTFLGGQGTLQIDSTGTTLPFSIPGGAIQNNDQIYLPKIAFDPAADSYNPNTGVITISDGTSADTVTIDLTSKLASGRNVFFEAADLVNPTWTGTLVYFAQHAPAGIAGSPINMALDNPSVAEGQTVTVTVSGVPSGWSLNEGTNLGNGTWTVQSNDLSALTVTTATAYVGAMVLGVTENWTNAGGSTGSATVPDNVEAYAPGSPIFALSGNDTLTGAGGNDEFVFAQPIGNDTICNFNVATDKIDLMGFTASFSDIHGNITQDSNGDAVITLGAGETITLQGVSASSLTANDFVFNQTPVVENDGSMVVSDGATLPLAGTIDNSGTISLNSSGDQTELQIVGDGVTLQGGGQVILSDSSENVIVGTNAATTLTNVDNTISGAGQIGIGDGNLTLVNETAGTIDANVAGGILTLDTGSNIVTNFGTLEASNGGELDVHSVVDNSGGTVEAVSGGHVDFFGAISGGNATIEGGTLEFGTTSNVSVTFDNGAGYGVLVLNNPAGFTGQISGFAGTAPDAAHSDVVELLNFADSSWSVQTCGSNEILTLCEANGDVAKLTFADFTGAFVVSSDGHGDTLIYDPPATGSSGAFGAHIVPSEITANMSPAQAGVSPASEVDAGAGALVSGLHGGSTQTLLSSLLNVLTGDDTFASIATSASGGDHGTAPAIGSGAANSEVTLSTLATAPTNEHIMAPALAPSPTVASATFGTLGNDSFAFHPNLGSDTAQNTGVATNELAHGSVQVGGPALGSTAPEFHAEFALDVIHQDDTHLAATVDQFHQMAANSTLLH